MPSRKLFNYDDAAMQNALKAIREENMKVSTACKKYNVPLTSVRNRLKGKTSDDCRRVGPTCALGEQVEKKLVNWILDCAARGFPINKEGLLFSVQKLIQECNLKTNFFKDTPGRKWFDLFLKRHPEVSKKHAEFINKARAAVSESRIRNWFIETKELLGSDYDVLSHPKQIFNLDETAIFLAPKGALILGPKGKNVYDVATSDKDNVTTLIAVNAEGMIAPPLTIFKFKRLPRQYAEAAPKDWAIGVSDSGWMQSQQFYEYFANVFIKFMEMNSIPHPVIVFMDGHSSHLSLNLSIFCCANGIILICLPPNTTHLLQPLDVAFFFPLKQEWRKITRKWLFEHDGRYIQKKDIPAALNTILTRQDFSKTIASIYRTCGLYPWNQDAPDYSRCLIRNSNINNVNEEKPGEAMYHLHFIENHIDPLVLETFNSKYASGSSWDGDERFLELFNFWRSIRNKNCDMGAPSSSLDVENKEENVLIFDFEEFDMNNEQNANENEKNIKVLQNIVIQPALQVDLPTEINLSSEVQTNPEIHTPCVQPALEGQSEVEFTLGVQSTFDATLEGQPQFQFVSEVQPEDQPEAQLTFEDPSEFQLALEDHPENKKVFEKNDDIDGNCLEDIKFLKKRTVSEVLKDVTTWPQEKNNVVEKKKKNINLPSVVTSDKWIQIFEAKTEATVKEKTRKSTKEKTVRKKTAKENKKKTAIQQNAKDNIVEETTSIGEGEKKLEEEIIEKVGTINENKNENVFGVGSFVIVKYQNDFYPAKILSKDNEDYYCCAMQESGVNNWKWPDPPDLTWYHQENIICSINEPATITSRGSCTVPEMKPFLKYV